VFDHCFTAGRTIWRGGGQSALPETLAQRGIRGCCASDFTGLGMSEGEFTRQRIFENTLAELVAAPAASTDGPAVHAEGGGH